MNSSNPKIFRGSKPLVKKVTIADNSDLNETHDNDSYKSKVQEIDEK